MDIVQRYIKALGNKDWTAFADTLAEDGFERIGPFADLVTSKNAYVEFLDRVVTPLADYSLMPTRLIPSADGKVVLAETTESFLIDGTPTAFPEALVFDLDDAGLIRRVQVFMMRPGEAPPGEGARAHSDTAVRRWAVPGRSGGGPLSAAPGAAASDAR